MDRSPHPPGVGPTGSRTRRWRVATAAAATARWLRPPRCPPTPSSSPRRPSVDLVAEEEEAVVVALRRAWRQVRLADADVERDGSHRAFRHGDARLADAEVDGHVGLEAVQREL